MATLPARDAAVYWGSGPSPTRIAETRNIALDLGSDFIEDTVHGDVNKSFTPTFNNFGATVTGLYNDAVHTVIDDAISKVEGYFYVYPKSSVSATYFYGRGFVSVSENSFPYDDYATLNWEIRASGTVTYKHA